MTKTTSKFDKGELLICVFRLRFGPIFIEESL